MNTATQPTNINDARRLANSWQKAMQLIKDGYNFLNCTVPNSPVSLVAVYKPNDAPDAPSYWIREGFTAPEISNGCTCPDYQRNGLFCKHTLCWEDMRITEAAIAEYEKEQEEAECAGGVDYLL